MVLVLLAVSSMAMAAETKEDAKPWTRIEELYTVQKTDTLDSIAETYMAKNTYGPREIHEFEESIIELNPELEFTKLKAGKAIHIAYWIKTKREK